MQNLFGIIDDGDKILFQDEDGEEQNARVVKYAGGGDYLIKYQGEEFEISATKIAAKICNGGYETRLI